MEEIKTSINIDDIKKFAQKVLGEIGAAHPCLKINSDYYWEIPMGERFSLDKPSLKNLAMGSINDDLEDISQEMYQEEKMVDWWDCELLSRIFMAISNELLAYKE